MSYFCLRDLWLCVYDNYKLLTVLEVWRGCMIIRVWQISYSRINQAYHCLLLCVRVCACESGGGRRRFRCVCLSQSADSVFTGAKKRGLCLSAKTRLSERREVYVVQLEWSRPVAHSPLSTNPLKFVLFFRAVSIKKMGKWVCFVFEVKVKGFTV